MVGERTNGAASAHEPNVCVVVIAFERNDDDVGANDEITEVETVEVLMVVSSTAVEDEGDDNVVSPDDEDTFALVVALSGMSIV